MDLKRNNHSKKLAAAGGLRNMNSKTIAAIVLVAVMALLWGRVLLKGKGGPATANAQVLQPQLSGQVNQPTVRPDKIATIKLDVLEGRHDVLSSNIFSDANWKEFDLEGRNEPSVDMSLVENNLEKKHQANLEKLAKTLKLEAVIQGTDGKPYQVFVNDAVLTVGSVLTVKEGSEQYQLVLQKVKENEALFVWNKTSITLKMTEMVEK